MLTLNTASNSISPEINKIIPIPIIGIAVIDGAVVSISTVIRSSLHNNKNKTKNKGNEKKKKADKQNQWAQHI